MEENNRQKRLQDMINAVRRGDISIHQAGHGYQENISPPHAQHIPSPEAIEHLQK